MMTTTDICTMPSNLAHSTEGIGLQPIVPSDFKRFLQFFCTKHPLSYGDSWVYILQAVNGYSLGLPELGYKMSSKEALCAVGFFYRPTDGVLCAHVVNPLGPNRGPATIRLCRLIREELGSPVYLKKVDRELSDYLLDKRDFMLATDQPWHSTAAEEDDSFAETILAVEKSLDLLSSGRHTQVRDKFNRFLNHARGKQISWKPLDETLYEDARVVIERFFSFKHEKHVDISSPHDYENMLLWTGRNSSDPGLTREVCYISGEPAALLILERLGETDSLGLYCNLALYQEHKYLSEYVVVTALRQAQAQGFKYLNLGGSESKGLDSFKTKFDPIAKHKRNWLLYI